jgi:ribosomal protein L12E/L44/L45/RPP1/RPP2|tara:strand:+ start:153 stop:371 length:219 start_codon:yes stop_codon:yes gene_type:complete
MDDDNDDGFAANRERDLDDILRELQQEQNTHGTATKRKQGEAGWGGARAQEEEEEEADENVELADMVAMTSN